MTTVKLLTPYTFIKNSFPWTCESAESYANHTCIAKIGCLFRNTKARTGELASIVQAEPDQSVLAQLGEILTQHKMEGLAI